MFAISNLNGFRPPSFVAVLKVGSTATKAEKAFNFWEQKQYGEPEKVSTSLDYMIMPFTYFREEGAE